MNVLKVEVDAPENANDPETTTTTDIDKASKYQKKRKNRKKTASELKQNYQALELKSQQREAETMQTESMLRQKLQNLILVNKKLFQEQELLNFERGMVWLFIY